MLILASFSATILVSVYACNEPAAIVGGNLDKAVPKAAVNSEKGYDNPTPECATCPPLYVASAKTCGATTLANGKVCFVVDGIFNTVMANNYNGTPPYQIVLELYTGPINSAGQHTSTNSTNFVPVANFTTNTKSVTYIASSWGNFQTEKRYYLSIKDMRYSDFRFPTIAPFSYPTNRIRVVRYSGQMNPC